MGVGVRWGDKRDGVGEEVEEKGVEFTGVGGRKVNSGDGGVFV